MSKQVSFHSDFASVTIFVDGSPLAVHGEVDITLKRPAKLSPMDNMVWDKVTKHSAQALSVVGIPAGEVK